MTAIILINSTPEESRVALLESNVLAEIHIERARDRGIAGTLQGKVVRVLPACRRRSSISVSRKRVLARLGFSTRDRELPIIDTDALERDLDSSLHPASIEADSRRSSPHATVMGQSAAHRRSSPTRRRHLVQVPRNRLPPRGTGDLAHLTPGRYLVYLHENHLGVSALEDETERQRLRTSCSR